MMCESPAPERDPEDGLCGDGPMGGIPAGMGAEQNREVPCCISSMKDRRERLESRAQHLLERRPVEVRETFPGRALERRERRGPCPRGCPGCHVVGPYLSRGRKVRCDWASCTQRRHGRRPGSW